MTYHKRNQVGRNDASDLVKGFRASVQEKKPMLSLGFLVTILIVFGVGFAVAFVFTFAVQPAVTHSDHKNAAFKELISAESKPVARDYPISAEKRNFQANKLFLNLKVNRTATGFDPIDSELHERCLKPIDAAAARWAESSGQASLDLANSVRFIVCTMRIQKSRFCDNFYRRRLASRIRDYLGAYNATLSTIRMAFRANKEDTDELLEYIRENGGYLGGSKIEITNKPITAYMGRHITSLSEMGLLGSRDFGGVFGGVPEEILPYLKDKPSPCR